MNAKILAFYAKESNFKNDPTSKFNIFDLQD